MNSMPIINVTPQEPQTIASGQKLAGSQGASREDAGKFDMMLSAHASREVPNAPQQVKKGGNMMPGVKGKTGGPSGKGKEPQARKSGDDDLGALMVLLGVLDQQLEKVQNAPAEISGFKDLSESVQQSVKRLLDKFAGKGGGESSVKGGIAEQIDSLATALSAIGAPDTFKEQLESLMEALKASGKAGKDLGAEFEAGLNGGFKAGANTDNAESYSLAASQGKKKPSVAAVPPSEQSPRRGLPDVKAADSTEMDTGQVHENRSSFPPPKVQKKENVHLKDMAEISEPSADRPDVSLKATDHVQTKGQVREKAGGVHASAGTNDVKPHFVSAPAADEPAPNTNPNAKDGLKNTMGREVASADNKGRRVLQEGMSQPAEYSNSDFKLLDTTQDRKQARARRVKSASHIERMSGQQSSVHGAGNGDSNTVPVSSLSKDRSGEPVLIVDFRPGIRHETDSTQTGKVLDRISGQNDLMQPQLPQSSHGNLQEMKAGYGVDVAKGQGTTDAAFRSGVLDQITQGVNTAVAMNRNRAVIHLNPPELGSVTIRLHVDHTNQVHASFLTEHMHTHQLLESGMESLRQQLGHNGFDLGQVNVNLSGGGMHDAGTSRREQSDHGKHRFDEMVRDDEVDAGIAAPVASAVLPGAAGGVHIIM